MNTPLGGATPGNISASTNHAENSSRAPSSYVSPSSSPRVPSINCSINSAIQSSHQGALINGTKRASYSDESVTSETSTVLPHVGSLGVGLNRTNGICMLFLINYKINFYFFSFLNIIKDNRLRLIDL